MFQDSRGNPNTVRIGFHPPQNPNPSISPPLITRGAAQAIKKWYAEMPDKLGAFMAKRREGEVTVKSTEEREELERLREKEFLESEGNYTNEVRRRKPVGSYIEGLGFKGGFRRKLRNRNEFTMYLSHMNMVI